MAWFWRGFELLKDAGARQAETLEFTLLRNLRGSQVHLRRGFVPSSLSLLIFDRLTFPTARHDKKLYVL